MLAEPDHISCRVHRFSGKTGLARTRFLGDPVCRALPRTSSRGNPKSNILSRCILSSRVRKFPKNSSILNPCVHKLLAHTCFPNKSYVRQFSKKYCSDLLHIRELTQKERERERRGEREGEREREREMRGRKKEKNRKRKKENKKENEKGKKKQKEEKKKGKKTKNETNNELRNNEKDENTKSSRGKYARCVRATRGQTRLQKSPRRRRNMGSKNGSPEKHRTETDDQRNEARQTKTTTERSAKKQKTNNQICRRV